MKKTLLLAALVLAACGTAGDPGPIGPTGPTGPTGPSYTRGDIYCVYTFGAASTAPGSPTAEWISTAACHDTTDLPLTGACSLGGPAGGQPPDLYVEIDQAANWNDTTKPAEWLCRFASATAAVIDTIPGPTTQMCCVAH